VKLLIAIPALNEEDSIASIIERCLAAAPRIVAGTEVDEVEVTVISDGSSDRTVEIASRYRDRINLIVFEKNRGYGKAIKVAWRQSDADRLGFLDADGTCDPSFFVPLCNGVVADGVAVEGGGRGLFTMVVLGAAAVLAGVTRLLDRFIDVVGERLRYEREHSAREVVRL
jgi:glycosyltransferase involved in cell wall biosynthesis